MECLKISNPNDVVEISFKDEGLKPYFDQSGNESKRLVSVFTLVNGPHPSGSKRSYSVTDPELSADRQKFDKEHLAKELDINLVEQLVYDQ